MKELFGAQREGRKSEGQSSGCGNISVVFCVFKHTFDHWGSGFI